MNKPIIKPFDEAFPNKQTLEKLIANFTGRKWLFKKIDDFLNQSEKQTLIITGEPGIGKSAISAKLIELYDVSAYHFFDALSLITLSPSKFIENLYFQLCKSIPGFSEAIVDQLLQININQNIEQNYGYAAAVIIKEFNIDNIIDKYSKLIVEPIKSLDTKNKTSNKILIIIDGLDNLFIDSSNNDFTIIDILKRSKNDLQNVYLILTSRFEKEVLRNFNEYILIEADTYENQSDIKEYIRNRVTRENSISVFLSKENIGYERIVNEVSQASKGNFLYCVSVLNNLSNNRQTFIDIHNLPEGLDGIYKEFLRNRSFSKQITTTWQKYLPLLGCLCASQEPLTLDLLEQFTSLKKQDLKYIVFDIEEFLTPIQSDKHNKLFQFWHRSFVDFLTDEEKADEFWIDVSQYHEDIADYYLSKYKEEWEQCDKYGLLYLSVHLSKSNNYDKLENLLSNITYNETKVSNRFVYELLTDFKLLLRHKKKNDVTIEEFYNLLKREASFLNYINLNFDESQVKILQHLRNRAYDSSHFNICNLIESVLQKRKKVFLRQINQTKRKESHLLFSFKAHQNKVSTLAISKDGKRLITGSNDSNVIIWDAETGKPIHILDDHKAEITGVCISADGQLIVSSSSDGTTRVWNAQNGDTLFIFSNNGESVVKIALSGNGNRVITALSNGKCLVWNTKTGDIIREFNETNFYHIPEMNDPSGTIQRTSSGKDMYNYSYTNSEKSFCLIHKPEKINDVTMSYDGNKALIAFSDFVLRLWDIEAHTIVPLLGHIDDIHTVSISNDGMRAVSGCGTHIFTLDTSIIIWDLESKEPIGIFKGHKSTVVCLAINDDCSKVVSVSNDNRMLLWDIETHRIITEFLGFTDSVTCLAFNVKDNTIISGHFNGFIYIWDPKEGLVEIDDDDESIGHNKNIESIMINSNKDKFVTGAMDGYAILWDLHKKKILKRFFHGGWVRHIAMSFFDNNLFTCGLLSNTLKTWNIPNAKEVGNFDTSSPFSKIINVSNSFTSIALSHDAGWLAVGFRDGTSSDHGVTLYTLSGYYIPPEFSIIIFDRKKNRHYRLQRFTSDVTALLIDSDKQELYVAEGRTISVWDIEKGDQLVYDVLGEFKGIAAEEPLWSFEGIHEANITTILFSHDKKLLVSASRDGFVGLWSIEEKKLFKMFNICNSAIKAVAISQDDCKLSIASYDHYVRIIDTHKGEIIGEFYAYNPVFACSFINDAEIVAIDNGGAAYDPVVYNLALVDFVDEEKINWKRPDLINDGATTTKKDIVFNVEVGIEEYRKLVANVEYNLGYSYLYSYGLPHNMEKAEHWLNQSVAKEHAPAEIRLGMIKLFSQNYTEAVKWFEKAVDRGDADAEYAFGSCYFCGYDVPRDYNKAFEYFQSASDKGNQFALFNLAICYEFGFGIQQNLLKAKKLYQDIADLNVRISQYAQLQLGLMCFQSKYTDSPDYTEALKWLEDAASWGNHRAHFYIGLFYEEGLGVNKNLNQSFLSYNRSGDKYAQYKLAYMYLNGIGVPTADTKEAIKHYQRAEKQGYRPQYNLGGEYIYLELYDFYIDYFNQGYNFDDSLQSLNTAIVNYKKALHFEPEHRAARFNIAVAFHTMGLFDNAIKEYREIIRMNPMDYEVRNNLFVVLSNKGLINDAQDQHAMSNKISSHVNTG